MTKRPLSPKKNRGFTLVEVCIAMAIMTVTLVPLMGLMANGLVQVGSNLDHNQAVNICQQVFVAQQQQSFSQLSTEALSGTPQYFYFTAEGDSLPSAASPGVVYTATVSYSTTTVKSPTPPLVGLKIQIQKTPGGATKGPLVATFLGSVSCQDISGFNAGTD